MAWQTSVLSLSVLVGSIVPASAGPITYVLTGSQQFGQMDLEAGTFSGISSIPATIQYLVSGPTGLLTMSFNGNLEAINKTTGAITVVGATGFSDCLTPTTPTCGPNSQLSLGQARGTIYATDFANNLYTVNPFTGRATLIGTTGIPAVPFIPASTNPDGSFDFYDENLFGVGGNLYANFDAATFNPATKAYTTVISPRLYRIDPSTGHATLLSSTDLGLITITNVNGTAYGFNGKSSQVVTLDVTNGQTKFVSNIDPALGLIEGASAATSVPEPGSLALVVLGLSIAAVHICRRERL